MTNVKNSIKYAVYHDSYGICGIGGTEEEAKMDAVNNLEGCNSVYALERLLDHPHGPNLLSEFYLSRMTEKLYTEVQQNGSPPNWGTLDNKYFETLCAIDEE